MPQKIVTVVCRDRAAEALAEAEEGADSESHYEDESMHPEHVQLEPGNEEAALERVVLIRGPGGYGITLEKDCTVSGLGKGPESIARVAG